MFLPDRDIVKAPGVQMGADGGQEAVGVAVDGKADLAPGDGLGGNGIGYLVGVTSLNRQHLERVPGKYPFRRRQARLTPIFFYHRAIVTAPHYDVRQHVAHRRRDRFGAQFGQQNFPFRSHQRGQGIGQAGSGIGDKTAPVAGMVGPVAQIDA